MYKGTMAYAETYPYANEAAYTVACHMDVSRAEMVQRIAAGDFDAESVKRCLQLVADVGALLRGIARAGTGLLLLRPARFAYPKVDDQRRAAHVFGTIRPGFQTNQLRVEYGVWLTVASTALTRLDPDKPGYATLTRQLKALAVDAESVCLAGWTETKVPGVVLEAVNHMRFVRIATLADVLHDIALSGSAQLDIESRRELLVRLYATREEQPVADPVILSMVTTRLFNLLLEPPDKLGATIAERNRVIEFIHRKYLCRQDNDESVARAQAAASTLARTAQVAYVDTPPVIAALVRKAAGQTYTSLAMVAPAIPPDRYIALRRVDGD